MRRRDVTLGNGDETCEPRLRRQQIVTIRVEAIIGNAIADREELPRRIEEKAKVHRVEHRVGEPDEGRKAADQRSRGCSRTRETLDNRIDSCKGIALCGGICCQARAESGEFMYGVITAVRRVGQGRKREKRTRDCRPTQRVLRGRRAVRERLPKDKPRPWKCCVKIADVTLYAGAPGPRPGEHLCVGIVTPFRSQRARNVRHGMSPGLEFSEAQHPITWSYRGRTEGRGQRVECFIQVFPRDRLRASVVADGACRFTEEENGVRNPGEHLRTKQRAVDDVLARLSERDEMTGEVSTVDRGYVFGIERAEVT